ncbi:glyoxalase bleomycin resistance dioxygenase [Trichoderma arundinaceum]|uniref:Glyoxalase bleomycin resistance dioxygenase n=1 Tax=Trichoderma arundinaceum TaxID=490622 RepID=A0A395NL46_TRIAR|nr:glyoxalase bleomycin resistance dioxygenase [Trichoderma arundinaceum]
MPIAHVLLRVARADFAPTVEFYTNVLKTLGLQKLPGFPEGMVGFGVAGPEFVLLANEKTSNAHVAFQAADTKAVDAFHAAALSGGAKDNGAPGARPRIHPQYYAAFFHDPVGNNIEAGTLTPA